jgi:DNA polymerase III subunit beta
MKFTITREKLQEGLAAVGGSIPTRTTLPVLSNLLIEAEEGGVRLSGTDLDTAVSVRVPAEVEEHGAITAPARKLQEIARELPPSPVSMATQGDAITITGGRSRFRLNGLPKDEFPAFPSVPFDGSWKLTGSELQQLITHVSFAVSTEETRPILNGVLWELREEEMRMVATNGHRLAKMSLPRKGGADGSTGDLIVHPRALMQVQKLFGPDAEVEIARSENHLGFRGGSAGGGDPQAVQIFTRLIEGPYPNYEQVIPKDNDKTLIAEKTALTGAIRRMAIVASDQTHRIRLSLGGPIDEVLGADARPGRGGGGARGRVRRRPDRDRLQRQLPAGAAALHADRRGAHVVQGPERAATMQPIGNEDTPDFLCLVMPLRLLD